MNAGTPTLVHRPFGDLVDDLLTAIVGGVVNEPVRFDVKQAAYPLAEPAAGIRGITGSHGDEPHTFAAGIDFQFSQATNSVVWQDGATLPDDDTTFYVDYLRVDSRSPLTDVNVGSVTRTLSEAIGREIATLYEEINLAYLAGFVDHATGRSLDLVVSILGVERKTAEFAEGLVTFFRASGVAGNITIPAGLPLTTAKGEARFVTSESRTLQTGQVRIDVPVRADTGFAGDAGLVDANAITGMTQPVAGIERITNLDPTIRAAAEETDEELRARAKAVLQALGKATWGALNRVIREGRGKPVELFDPNSPIANRSAPGTLSVVLETDPQRLAGLRTAVHDTRAAGVVATLVARYVFVTPRLVATTTVGTEAGKTQVADDVVAALQDYVDGLARGDPAEGAAMLEAITGVDGVESTEFRDVVVQRADLADPGGRDVVDELVAALDGVALDDPAAVREALTAAVTEETPQAPTGARVPDRSLLESTATPGAPASDDDIEAGDFLVSAEVAGEAWWIALAMGRDDVAVEERRAED